MTTLRRKLRLKIYEVLENTRGLEHKGLADTLADELLPIVLECQDTPQSAVISVVSQATGIVTIPPTEYARIEQISVLIRNYGKSAVVNAFRWAFDKWTTTRRVRGGNYSRLNFGWVDWGQEKLMEDAENSKVCKKTETEEVWINGELFLKPVEVKA